MQPLAHKVPGAAAVRLWFVDREATQALPDLLSLFKAEGVDPNDILRLTIKAAELDSVLPLARTLPMLGTYRVLVVEVPDGEQVKQASWLKRWASLPATARLVLVGVCPRRVSKQLAGVAAVLPALTEEDLVRYVRTLGTELGVRYTGDAAHQLVRRHPHRDRLAAEVFRIAATTQRVVLTPKDLPQGPELTGAAPVLLALSRSRLDDVLQLAGPWWAEGNLDGLLHDLSGLVTTLFRIRWANLSVSEASRAFKCPPDRAATLCRTATDYPLDQLRGWVGALAAGTLRRTAPLDTLLTLLATGPA